MPAVPVRDQRVDLERQVAPLIEWAPTAPVVRVAAKVASGMTGRRSKPRRLLADPTVATVVVVWRVTDDLIATWSRCSPLLPPPVRQASGLATREGRCDSCWREREVWMDQWRCPAGSGRWGMSQKRKRSRGPRGRTAPRHSLADGRMRTRLWPVAVHWYVSQERLALYGGVRVRQRPDGAAFVSLPGVGEVRLPARQVPSALTEPGSELAAAVLTCDGAWDALIGVGETAAGAIDEVLAAIEQAFVDEVGSKRAQSISVSVLNEHPELADEQLARGYLSMVVIGGRSW